MYISCNTFNICFIKIRTKHSSNTLLSLEQICENKFGEKKHSVNVQSIKTNIWWLELCTFYTLFQAVLNLTRELRFVENEFHFLKEPQDRERMGYSLKYLGRRLLELVDELVNILETKDWKITNHHLLNKEEATVSATVNLTEF